MPRLVVVSNVYKQGPLVLPQLPAGAAIVAPVPRLLKPTLVPTFLTPTTAITPLQLAGVLMMALSLPAEATTLAPTAVTFAIASA